MIAWHQKRDPNFVKFESGNHAIYAISRLYVQKEIFFKRILKQRESLWTAKWQAESDAKTRTTNCSFLFSSVYLRRWNQHRYFSCVYAMLSFWRRGTWGPRGSWDSGTVSCADSICVCWTARPTNKRFQSQIKKIKRVENNNKEVIITDGIRSNRCCILKSLVDSTVMFFVRFLPYSLFVGGGLNWGSRDYKTLGPFYLQSRFASAEPVRLTNNRFHSQIKRGGK